MATLLCFTAGDIYSFDGNGTLDIFTKKKGDGIRYFFRALGKDGTTIVNYRLDGDAVIVPNDPGISFPNGDTTGFTVHVTNLRVSQDTGKRGNECEGSFPEVSATIRLDRK